MKKIILGLFIFINSLTFCWTNLEDMGRVFMFNSFGITDQDTINGFASIDLIELDEKSYYLTVTFGEDIIKDDGTGLGKLLIKIDEDFKEIYKVRISNNSVSLKMSKKLIKALKNGIEVTFITEGEYSNTIAKRCSLYNFEECFSKLKSYEF